MKLHQSAINTGASSYYFNSTGVDEQQHWRDERGQATCKFSSALGTDVTCARLIQHKANRIRACGNSSVNVLLSRQAADFDSGSLVYERP